MFEFLDYPIQIAISTLILIILIFMLLSQMPFIYYWLENRKWNPEGKIFQSARKKGYPIIETVAMSGFTVFELGEKDIKGDPVFKVDRSTNQGVHLDPRLSSGGAPREFIAGGAELMHYSTSSPVAMSSKNALAMITIVKHIRNDYPFLAFLPDQLIVEYVNRNRADLPHDCKNIVETYDFDDKIVIPQTILDAFREDIIEQLRGQMLEDGKTEEPSVDEIDALYQQNISLYKKQYQSNSLVSIFQKIQDEVVGLPVETNRYFSFVEAFQNSPIATFAADLQNYLQTIELIAEKKKSLGEKDKLMYFAFVVVVIFIGGALAYKMLGE
jgi:hypothetical protein